MLTVSLDWYPLGFARRECSDRELAKTTATSKGSAHTCDLWQPGVFGLKTCEMCECISHSPVLPDNIHKMSVALFSEVFGTQLDQGRVVHPGARWPCATGHAQTGAGPCASAGLLLFLLEHVAQGALAGSHRVLQRWAQEAVSSPGAETWGELDGEKRKGQKQKKEGESENRDLIKKADEKSSKCSKGFLTNCCHYGSCLCVCVSVCCALALLVLCSSWQPFSTAPSSPCSAPTDKTPLRDT